MPRYMKIDRFLGPITEGNYRGWFEIRSAQWNEQFRSPAMEVWHYELEVTKQFDQFPWGLFAKSREKDSMNVTIAYITQEKGVAQEDARIVFIKATIRGSWTTGTKAGELMESLAFRAQDLKIERGPPAHASLLVRPQDWGSIQAVRQFGRTSVA